jgi:hypothetical protein
MNCFVTFLYSTYWLLHVRRIKEYYKSVHIVGHFYQLYYYCFLEFIINVMDLDTQYVGNSLRTALTFVKYVGCFQDTFIQRLYKEIYTF